jgi:hypothetical protein
MGRSSPRVAASRIVMGCTRRQDRQPSPDRCCEGGRLESKCGPFVGDGAFVGYRHVNNFLTLDRHGGRCRDAGFWVLLTRSASPLPETCIFSQPKRSCGAAKRTPGLTTAIPQAHWRFSWRVTFGAGRLRDSAESVHSTTVRLLSQGSAWGQQNGISARTHC